MDPGFLAFKVLPLCMKCLLIPRKSFFEFFKALGQTQQIPFGVSPKFRYHPGELSWKSGVLGGILAPRA